MPDFSLIPTSTLRAAARELRHQADVLDAHAAPDEPPPPQWGPLSNQSRLGVGLDTADSNGYPIYRDASRSGWPVGSNGGANNHVVFVEQRDAHGTYTVITTNPTTIARLSGGASVTSSTDAKVFKVNVPAGQDNLTIRYGSDPGPVKVFRPGYTSDTDSLFTREFLTQLAPFGGVRFMDLLRTNGNPLVSWADRPVMSDASWSTVKGAPLEVCIALCNETGKDGYFNLPHGCDDGYVEGFRKLIESTLRPDVNVFVEYGNETWNSAPPFNIARNYILAQARAAIAAGDETIIVRDSKGPNVTYSLWRCIARRTVEIAKQLGPRFKMILAGQNANVSVLKTGLEYIAEFHGPPSDYIHAIATAPYFGYGSASTRDDLTPDTVAGLLVQGANPAPDKRLAHKQLADKYGVKFIAYEGGTHTDQSASPQAVVDAQMLDRTGEAVEKYLTNMLTGTAGMDAFFYFVLGSSWGFRDKTVSVWGLTPSPLTTSPKYDAAKRVAEAVRT